MQKFIELMNGGHSLGYYDLPDHIRSASAIYRLNYAARGGGNGIVFNANRMAGPGAAAESCAIKFLRQQGPARLDRFNNEIRVLQSLASPHTATYHDDGVINVTAQGGGSRRQEVRWLAMDLGGANMRQHIETSGPLTLRDLKRAGSEICAAVDHLHCAGFIHRDIKPDNFVWKNDASSIMMIDFGLAKRFGEDVSARPMDTFTQVREFVGPVFFSSPELIEYAGNKSHPVDHRSDIFQIGKVLWFLATGKISAGIPSKRDCPANGRLRDLIVHMIDDDPDSRPQSVAGIPRLIDDV